MRERAERYYAQVADRLEADPDLLARDRFRRERADGAYGSMMVVDPGQRAFVDFRKWHPKQRISFEVNADGRRYWMTRNMRWILMFAKDEIRHGRTIHPKAIAELVGCSTGYVSRVLHRLSVWRFIAITSVVRGRLGGIFAKAVKRLRVNVSSLSRSDTDPARREETLTAHWRRVLGEWSPDGLPEELLLIYGIAPAAEYRSQWSPQGLPAELLDIYGWTK